MFTSEFRHDCLLATAVPLTDVKVFIQNYIFRSTQAILKFCNFYFFFIAFKNRFKDNR